MLVRQVLPFSSRTFLKRISLVHEFSTTSCSQGLVTQEISNRVLTVTMNRPELSNAFNEDLIEEMIKVFTNVDTNLVKVVVLTGSGKQFSAGADLNWMKKMVNYTKEENEEDAGKLFEMFRVIRSLPLPTIARVNGAALGGGAGLVAACDIAIGCMQKKKNVNFYPVLGKKVLLPRQIFFFPSYRRYMRKTFSFPTHFFPPFLFFFLVFFSWPRIFLQIFFPPFPFHPLWVFLFFHPQFFFSFLSWAFPFFNSGKLYFWFYRGQTRTYSCGHQPFRDFQNWKSQGLEILSHRRKIFIPGCCCHRPP
eukprot:TRINITY_DN4762_c0_g2_i1.p1 TRINITY_DN4762_c0_g2~~TRINITY_DN4762_c0_g2_i1.p1  ORF type:complete len:306 (-),score=50.38 TRINITY_DN4762_c0_g2_i1:361-1278(-)